MEGLYLKELLLSYNASYILEVDVEGMISVKKYIYNFCKKQIRRLYSQISS
jgi:hypothetical protein